MILYNKMELALEKYAGLLNRHSELVVESDEIMKGFNVLSEPPVVRHLEDIKKLLDRHEKLVIESKGIVEERQKLLSQSDNESLRNIIAKDTSRLCGLHNEMVRRRGQIKSVKLNAKEVSKRINKASERIDKAERERQIIVNKKRFCDVANVLYFGSVFGAVLGATLAYFAV